MKKPRKAYVEKLKLVDRKKRYSPQEAFDLVKKTGTAKFDETIELAMKLGADPKKHSVRGTVMLPAGSGKSKRVAVIAKGDKVAEAESAGADVFGADDLVEKIKEGFLEFDILIVTPDMMGSVGKLGKVLGPKGLMPNPKTGTVTMEIAKTVKEFKGGKIEFKMDKTAALHIVLGKLSFAAADLKNNFQAALNAVLSTKPSGLKSNFVESMTIAATMGPGIKIDPRVAAEAAEKGL
ncbi:MAG: 50S ribosomal protein L1 [bacterium]|nr:50S ribosomal protein L1 [Candidatus Margulisiibacteriota bacterium]